MRRPANDIAFAALTALLLGLPAAACRPTTGPRRAAPRFEAQALTGQWVGVKRDDAAAGLRRSTAVLLDLQADPRGGVSGSLVLRGELAAENATSGATPPCAPGKPWVVVKRSATLAGGRWDGRRVELPLTAPTMEGPATCGALFPLGTRCTGRPAGDGLLLTCGSTALRLHPARLTGTWVYDEERADRTGDTVAQRLRVHLVQAGAQVTGQADDIRVHSSGDGQRYRCNGRLRYDRQARHRLRGTLKGLTLELKVDQSVPKSGPCQGELTLPPTITGEWKPLEGQLRLKLGEDKRTLWRRPPPSAKTGNR